MIELPLSERLEKHRTLAAWLEYQLRQEQRIVAGLEKQIAEDTRRREVARRERSFKIQPQRAGRDALLHRGGCNLFKGEFGLITAKDAVIALHDAGMPITPCDICNPLPALNGIRLPEGDA